MSVKFISPKKSVNSATFEFPAVKNLLLSFDIEKLEQTGAKHVVNDEEIKGLPLLAIFNSNLVKLWIEYNCPVLNGGARNISKTYFENLRIPLDNAELLQKLAELADEIIAAKKQASCHPERNANDVEGSSEVLQVNKVPELAEGLTAVVEKRVSDLETQANTLVYQLYSITDTEEIEAVEKR